MPHEKLLILVIINHLFVTDITILKFMLKFLVFIGKYCAKHVSSMLLNLQNRKKKILN